MLGDRYMSKGLGYNYVEIEGIPNRLLDRLLVEASPMDALDRLIKDCQNPKIKVMKLKYKVNPKQKLKKEQIVGILLDYFEPAKGNEIYTILNKELIEFCDERIEDIFGEDVDIEEDFLENVEELVQSIEMPEIITYIRQKYESLHKYLPALINTWIKTKDFEKSEIEDMYGFNYDKTFEEEFGVRLNFELLDKDMIMDKNKFTCMMEASDTPILTGMQATLEQMMLLMDATKRITEEEQSKVKSYEGMVIEKEKEINDLRKQLRTLKKSCDSLSKSNETMSAQINNNENQVDELNKDMVLLNKKITILENEKKKMTSDAKAYKKELSSMSNIVKKNEEEIKELKKINNELLSLKGNYSEEIELKKIEISKLNEKLEVELNKIVDMESREDGYKKKISELEAEIESIRKEKLEMVKSEVAISSEEVSNEEYLGGDFLEVLSNDPTF